jgi:hypothetical protein
VGPSAEVIIHVDAEALARGEIKDGERCEIKGVGPVSLGTLRCLLGDAWAKIVIEKGVDVLNVTHVGRVKRAHLETALWTRDPCCAVPGCGITYGLERDHITAVCDQGPTSLENLVLLCHHHHQMKTRHFFRLSGPPGARVWQQVKPLPGEQNRQAGNGGKARRPGTPSGAKAASGSTATGRSPSELAAPGHLGAQTPDGRSQPPSESGAESVVDARRQPDRGTLACERLCVSIRVPDSQLEHERSATKPIERFDRTERLVHWSTDDEGEVGDVQDGTGEDQLEHDQGGRPVDEALGRVETLDRLGRLERSLHAGGQGCLGGGAFGRRHWLPPIQPLTA